MRVVIADDSQIMADVAASLCMQCGFTIVAKVSNGKDAVDAILKLKPDLALLDYIMSPMSGADAVLELRKRNIKTKIIFTTSMGQQSAAYNPELKVDGVVIKPLTKAVLMQAIAIAFA